MVTLYAVQGEITRRVKIGRTTDMLDRMRALQACSPDVLHVIGTDTRGMSEGAIHAALSDHRLHGEWFAPIVGEMITLEGFSPLVDRLLTRYPKVRVVPHVGKPRTLSVNVFDMSRYIRY